MAYLFSSHHLSEEELIAVASRVKAGDRPDPPEHLLQRARSELTQSLSQLPGPVPEAGADQRSLTREEAWLLLLGNVVLTPLLGLAVWWGWRHRHPQAANRVLWMTLPIVAVLGGGWWLIVLLFGEG